MDDVGGKELCAVRGAEKKVRAEGTFCPTGSFKLSVAAFFPLELNSIMQSLTATLRFSDAQRSHRLLLLHAALRERHLQIAKMDSDSIKRRQSVRAQM